MKKTAEFLNEADVILPDIGGNYEPGRLYFANDSRFSETFYSEPLTNYIVGWRDNSGVEDTLNFIAPPVPVGRRFEYKSGINAEEFLSEVVDDGRAIGADFKRIEYTGKDVTAKTYNRGLTYIADLDNVFGPNWQNDKVAKITRRLYRNELRRAIAALAAAATNSNVTWSTGSSNNPDQNVLTDLLTATTATGVRPNRVLYGDSAWNNRHISYEAVASTSTAFGMIAGFNEQQLAQRLMVDKVMVSKSRYQSAAATKQEILGSIVYAWFAEDGVDTEDPSNLKRFVTAFDAEQGGGMIRVYVQQISSKLVAITVEHYTNTLVTYSSGIRKWTVS
jgi:hypothetical protein